MTSITHRRPLSFASRTLRTLLTSGAALALLACGSGASPASQPTQITEPVSEPTETEQPAAEPVEPVEEPAPTPAPSYVLHEWGFIAASLANASVTAVAGPHGLSAIAPPSLGHGSGVGAGGKPVLYFHLDEGGSEFALSVGVRPAGEGELLEHFPPGELSADRRTLSWPDVRITRGACRGSYPALTDPACRIADGLCEQAELPGYESAAADCVNVGGQRTGVLFYRSGPAAGTLPVAVTRRPQDVVRLTHVAAVGPTRASGWAMRIARGADRSQSRVRIVALSGSRVDVPPATGDGSVAAEEGIAQLRAAVLAGGLDEPEANAFMAAWTDALFGAEPAPPAPTQPPDTIGMGQSAHARQHPLASVADALIYIVPQASVDALLPLELTPAPRTVQRVFLARVTLSEEPLLVRLQRPTVEGPMSPDVARRVLLRNNNAFRACLESVAMPGRITLSLNVLPTGVVERVTLEGLDVGNTARSCLQGLAQRLQFPVADAAFTVAQPILISR